MTTGCSVAEHAGKSATSTDDNCTCEELPVSTALLAKAGAAGVHNEHFQWRNLDASAASQMHKLELSAFEIEKSAWPNVEGGAACASAAVSRQLGLLKKKTSH